MYSRVGETGRGILKNYVTQIPRHELDKFSQSRGVYHAPFLP